MTNLLSPPCALENERNENKTQKCSEAVFYIERKEGESILMKGLTDAYCF